MARLLYILLILLMLYYLLRLLFKPMASSGKKRDPKANPEELVQDPYCQTYIPKGSALKKRVAGRDYYFCKKECFNQFLRQSKSKPSQKNV